MKHKTVYPYIPNSVPEVQEEMLRFVDAKDTMELYEEIPEHLKLKGSLDLPAPIRDEQSIKRHVEKILSNVENCGRYDNYMGAGCAQHYVPAICDEITSRGELLTSYSSEAWTDHGKYQIFFEYQSMMADLLNMDFLTFPCHCGGQATSSALRMASRLTGRSKVLVPKTMNPQNLLVAKNYLRSVQAEFAVEIETVDYDKSTGRLDLEDLKKKLNPEIAAVLIENPNYLGVIEEDAEEICALAKNAGAEFIVYADPITLGVMKPPADYGATLAVGDIHSLGLHLHCGGAQGGYIASFDDMRYFAEFKEQVFGLVETKVPGEYGFAQILPERTHYSLREKGKEFTGTQNNLWMAPAAVYMALMGPQGMQEIGRTIMTNSHYAAKKLSEIPGVKIAFGSAAFFKEFVVSFDGTGKTVGEINKKLLEYEIFGGVDLSTDYPELGQSALYCVTEIASKDSIDRLAAALKAAAAD